MQKPCGLKEHHTLKELYWHNTYKMRLAREAEGRSYQRGRGGRERSQVSDPI